MDEILIFRGGESFFTTDIKGINHEKTDLNTLKISIWYQNDNKKS